MKSLLLQPSESSQSRSIESAVAAACSRISPLWDLPNYVAVNPFLGYSGTQLAEAAKMVKVSLQADILPPLDWYQSKWREGAFDIDDLKPGCRSMSFTAEFLRAVLEGKEPLPTESCTLIPTLAEALDQELNTVWTGVVRRVVSRWINSFLPAIVGGDQLDVPQTGLYSAWRESAQIDRSLEIAGLRGWRQWVKALPESHTGTLSSLLARNPIDPSSYEAYFLRLVSNNFGWASLLRRSDWKNPEQVPGLISELLAILLACDQAVFELIGKGQTQVEPRQRAQPSNQVLTCLQTALENGRMKTYFGHFQTKNDEPEGPSKPRVQAIFCIDVRSEPVRRHLEAIDPAIHTLGFAGFFGVRLDWKCDGSSSPRCPVLLDPGYQLSAPSPDQKSDVPRFLDSLTASPAAFSFVETFGLGYLFKLIGDVLGRGSRDSNELDGELSLTSIASAIPLEQRITLADSILKNTSLGRDLAPLVVLFGHGGCSENNAHAAGLDCGACGGHSGVLNARVAALILNDPEVKRQLGVPDETLFLAGYHNTSNDELKILDPGVIPADHRAEVDRFRADLETAGVAVRQERAPSLRLEASDGSQLLRDLNHRARDWSEVRPEWGLARNAFFVAGRRDRTRGLNLDGRAFLHEYDASKDFDDSVLDLILAAPMVVASWINLQYFASTVDNDRFGAGIKPLQNRVGTLGVIVGNDGDLRTGLALESVTFPDGHWYHEPLRLQVVIEVEEDRLRLALSRNPAISDLVRNGWIRLFALDFSKNDCLEIQDL